MQLIYNSDSFAVMHFVAALDAGMGGDAGTDKGAVEMTGRADPGGYEIVDKLARKEIFLRGAVAESFERGVKALVDQGEDPEALEDYIACYTVLAQQPVMLH